MSSILRELHLSHLLPIDCGTATEDEEIFGRSQRELLSKTDGHVLERATHEDARSTRRTILSSAETFNLML